MAGVLAMENERCSSRAGDLDVDVLAGLEGEPLRVDERDAQQADVVRELLDGLHAALGRLKRDPAAQDLLVEVEQLDLEVGHRVRAAEQGVALRLLEVGQREGRVALEVDLPVEQERLAGRALPLLAAVHEHQALAEGCVEDRLVLVDLDLDVHRLKPDGELLPIDVAPRPPAAPLAQSGAATPGRLNSRRPLAPGGRPARRPCTWPCTSRAPQATSR